MISYFSCFFLAPPTLEVGPVIDRPMMSDCLFVRLSGRKKKLDHRIFRKLGMNMKMEIPHPPSWKTLIRLGLCYISYCIFEILFTLNVM